MILAFSCKGENNTGIMKNQLKKQKEILWCESQSGFDGRKLQEIPHLGELIKKAGFRYPRIAWDWGYKEFRTIKKQLDILINAGYGPKDIFVFMLYNWNIPFEEMEKKRIKCWEWGIQIADCRYRPLNQLFDNYNSRKSVQTNKDKENNFTLLYFFLKKSKPVYKNNDIKSKKLFMIVNIANPIVIPSNKKYFFPNVLVVFIKKYNDKITDYRKFGTQ